MAIILKTDMPNAWIVRPKDRGRKSIKGGKVFLKDGDYFEIELYNPLRESVLADIKLNGSSISTAGLIIKPGQRVYLDCFTDTLKKFKFSTYEVENTESSIDAISKNGILEVFFYEETINDISIYNTQTYLRTYYVQPYWTNPFIYGSTSTTFTSNSTDGVINLNMVDNSINCSSNIANNDLYSIFSKTLPTSSIETGRIEGGDKSEQTFKEVNMNFSKYVISSRVIKILPESMRPIEIIKKKKTNINNVDDIISLIEKLKSLHDSGILTKDEFKLKKDELLSRI